MERKSSNWTSLHEIAHDYINNMIENVKEMKAIILDKETQVMFSLEFSKSLALKQEIFMFENIEKVDTTQKTNLSAIFFIRPTEANVKLLVNILQGLNFKEIHLNFTNTLSDHMLNTIAEHDTNKQVKTIQEVYLDYYVINSNLYHFGIESCIMNLSIKPENQWQKYDEMLYSRILEGLISLVYSNRVNPVVKCVRGSKICYSIGQRLAKSLNENVDFIRRECSKEANALLFIFDRKEDPVTPLLNQWTYQAMIHELIGIHNNIVDIKSKDGKSEKFVLSDYDDKFFSMNLNNDYGTVATEVEAAGERLKRENDEIANKDTSLEEMRKMIDQLPEKKKESMTITKHYKLFYEISEYVTDHKLMDISSLEQDIACHDNKKDQFNKIIQIIKDKRISSLDKAKLYLLFSFRYEGDSMIGNLKGVLEENNMKDWIEYGDLLIQYAGKDKRVLDVLSNKDFLSKSKSMLMSSFTRGQNAFLQHVPYLSSVVERVYKGKNKESEIETLYKNSERERINKILVFAFGGITYEEAMGLSALSKQLDVPIIVGGTYVHNSKSFLAEMLMLKNRGDSFLQINI